MKATFSWMKNKLFSPQFPRTLKFWNSHFRALKFQNFLEKHAPRSPPPRERGLTAPCWYSWLLYSHLLQFLLKPLGVTLQQNTDFCMGIECFHSHGQNIHKFIGTKEGVCIRKEFHSESIIVSLPFHCFGAPIWPPWPHVKTLLKSHFYMNSFSL